MLKQLVRDQVTGLSTAPTVPAPRLPRETVLQALIQELNDKIAFMEQERRHCVEQVKTCREADINFWDDEGRIAFRKLRGLQGERQRLIEEQARLAAAGHSIINAH